MSLKIQNGNCYKRSGPHGQGGCEFSGRLCVRALGPDFILNQIRRSPGALGLDSNNLTCISIELAQGIKNKKAPEFL
ncbi:Uncharacterised protein [Candidatus Gugararchaeum adminiculabundum]|nr:Uncharacterised protein [Candidatus Gugararchaeum adminiculabundum]